jgi:tetratricopeptide (TPR) repeat protein
VSFSNVPLPPVTDEAPSVVPLPPQPVTPPRPDDDSGRPQLYGVDLLLASFVVLLAFLAASTAARNSDVWLHLAAGRALADGSYRFQGDPFGQSAGTWINHAWLYDLLSYGLYAPFPSLDGSLLVIAKALLAAVLAGLLIRVGANGGIFWAALSAALSIVALSGRLLLQPALVSVVLLAGTLALLQRGRRRRGEGAGWLSAYGPICVLFALWANLDDWFLLGPLTVGLFLLGDVLAIVAGGDKRRADPSGLGLTLVAGLAACLLTPFHIHGFTLPVELGLSDTARTLNADPFLRFLFASPFEATYFHTGTSWNIAALAYLALVVLGGLSFVLSRDAWRSWRLPVWVGFFALSGWSVQAVPFFVAVAAPILALNVGDWALRLRSDGSRQRDTLLTRLGRSLALMALVGLLAVVWPGWLQGVPYETRRWVVLADPSLQDAAEQLAAWRKDKLLLSDERGFNFTPKSANYFASICPAEKGHFDGRMLGSADEAQEYVRIRRVLGEAQPAKDDWRTIFRAKRINHIVLDGSDRRGLSVAFPRLLSSPEWFLMSISGNTAIFGWNDPKKDVPPPRCPPFSPSRQAYRPDPDKLVPDFDSEAQPESPPWWKVFVTKLPASHADREEAGLLLLYFDLLQGEYFQRNQDAWDASRIAFAVGAGSGTVADVCHQFLALNCFAVDRPAKAQEMPPLSSPARILATGLQRSYLMAADDGPPELLWLAIRAARRATHADPNDASAYSFLGDAYLRMARNTRERAFTDTNPPALPFLRRLRAVQTSAAYNRALQLDPDLLPAHLGLITLYDQFRLFDLSLHHVREELRILQARGAAAAANREQFAQTIADLQEQVRQREQRQQKDRNSYEVGTAKSRTVVERAGTALDRGLTETALKLLLNSDVAAFGAEGVEMELGLLLIGGQTDRARAWLLPEHEIVLGPEAYHLYRLQLTAALGDYQRADAELKHMLDVSERPIEYYQIHVTVPQALALSYGQMMLDGRAELDSLPRRYVVYENRQKLLTYMMKLLDGYVKNADIRGIRGLLALENGNVAEADRQFREALQLYAAGTGIDFNSRELVEHYRSQMTPYLDNQGKPVPK